MRHAADIKTFGTTKVLCTSQILIWLSIVYKFSCGNSAVSTSGFSKMECRDTCKKIHDLIKIIYGQKHKCKFKVHYSQ